MQNTSNCIPNIPGPSLRSSSCAYEACFFQELELPVYRRQDSGLGYLMTWKFRFLIRFAVGLWTAGWTLFPTNLSILWPYGGVHPSLPRDEHESCGDYAALRTLLANVHPLLGIPYTQAHHLSMLYAGRLSQQPVFSLSPCAWATV